MKLYCTPEFRKEYEKLIKNKSYRGMGKEIISIYFDKDIKDCLHGTRLNGTSPNPFIKKRIQGSGGSRLYLILILKKDSAYLAFIHPKTGSAGSDNITEDKQAELINTVYNCIENNDLFEVTCCKNKENLIFETPKKEVEVSV